MFSLAFGKRCCQQDKDASFSYKPRRALFVKNLSATETTERSRQKTDRRDARQLSHLLWVHRQQFLEGKHPLGVRRVQPPTAQEADDRQITALRARLTKKRTAVLNGIHKILRKHNLEQDCPTKVFQTQKVRRWLAAMELPGNRSHPGGIFLEN